MILKEVEASYSELRSDRENHQHNSHEYHLTDKQAEAYEIYLSKLKEG